MGCMAAHSSAAPGLLKGTGTGAVLRAVGQMMPERPDGTEPAGPQRSGEPLSSESGQNSGLSQAFPILGGGIPAACQAGPHVACSPHPASLSSNQGRWGGGEGTLPQPSEASIPGSLPARGPRSASSPQLCVGCLVRLTTFLIPLANERNGRCL